MRRTHYRLKTDGPDFFHRPGRLYGTTLSLHPCGQTRSGSGWLTVHIHAVSQERFRRCGAHARRLRPALSTKLHSSPRWCAKARTTDRLQDPVSLPIARYPAPRPRSSRAADRRTIEYCSATARTTGSPVSDWDLTPALARRPHVPRGTSAYFPECRRPHASIAALRE